MKQVSHGDIVAEEELRDEPFMQRFNRRKREARIAQAEDTELQQEEIADEALPTDEDMPPIESLTPDSDFSPFMSPKVSEGLRKLALRKLFHSAEFNLISELDDYVEDFTGFAPLGDFITSDMRHQLEVEAERRLEEMMNRDDAEEFDEETVPGKGVTDEMLVDEGDTGMDGLDVESDS
jgi:hypothetical protein